MAKITTIENPELFENLSYVPKAKITKIGEILENQITARQAAAEQENVSKAAVRPLAKQAYFEANEDVSEAAQTAAIHTFDFGQLQVNFVNAYVIRDKAHADEILDLLGDDHPLAAHIQVNHHVVVDVTTLTTDTKKFVAYGKALSALNKQYGLQATVEDKFRVSEQFHDVRHEMLTAQDNLELDNILPVQVQFTLNER